MPTNYIKVPITIRDLIEIPQSELDYVTVYRPGKSGELTENSILYLDDEQTEYDSEADEEIYPPFVVDNHLEYYFNGDIATDILRNTRHQLEAPSLQDYLKNFNYYDQHDCFYTFT